MDGLELYNASKKWSIQNRYEVYLLGMQISLNFDSHKSLLDIILALTKILNHTLSLIEILERNQSQFENSLRNIKEQFGTLGEKFTAGKLGSFSIQNHLKETDCHLRTGDSFRLRSVKFPDYEMGVTSVKLKDEFCYVGLRKVRTVSVCVSVCISSRNSF